MMRPGSSAAWPLLALFVLLVAMLEVEVTHGARVSGKGGAGSDCSAGDFGEDEPGVDGGAARRSRPAPAKVRAAIAQNRTAEHWRAVALAEARGETGQRGAWKWGIRQRIWDDMEAGNLSVFPRPAHHRTPNFAGAELAAAQVEHLEEFQSAKVVQVNTDQQQIPIRLAALKAGKTLLVLHAGMESGLFLKLDPAKIDASSYSRAVTQAGIKKFGEPVDLDAAALKVDLIVAGSVAVDRVSGARIGKGEGFTELGYGILRAMGAVDASTPVVTTVHDLQVVDLPEERMMAYDVPMGVICTPTQTLRVEGPLAMPVGIYWALLSPQRLRSMRILQDLRARVEAETGEAVPTGKDEILPPKPLRNKNLGVRGKGCGGGGGGGSGGAAGPGDVADPAAGGGNGTGDAAPVEAAAE